MSCMNRHLFQIPPIEQLDYSDDAIRFSGNFLLLAWQQCNGLMLAWQKNHKPGRLTAAERTPASEQPLIVVQQAAYRWQTQVHPAGPAARWQAVAHGRRQIGVHPDGAQALAACRT